MLPEILSASNSESVVVKLAYQTEVAAFLSAHGHLVVEQPDPVSIELLGDFYMISRNRFNRWIRDLNDVCNGVEIRGPRHIIGLTPTRSPVLSITEQILINDLVNRVWTVLLIACDRRRSEKHVEPLVRNVFQGHLSARHKALAACLSDKSLRSGQIREIDQLRCSIERWADLLCCPLMKEHDLWSLAFDPVRAREFCGDRFDHQGQRPKSHAWTLILAGLRNSFPDDGALGAPLHDEDRLISHLMLDTFPRTPESLAVWSGPTIVRTR